MLATLRCAHSTTTRTASLCVFIEASGAFAAVGRLAYATVLHAATHQQLAAVKYQVAAQGIVHGYVLRWLPLQAAAAGAVADGEYVFAEHNPFLGDTAAYEKGKDLFKRGLLSEAALALEAEVGLAQLASVTFVVPFCS